MNLSAISHRTALTDCYALNDRELVINLRTGKDVTAVTLLHDDPYAYGISGDIQWVGKPAAMTVQRELKHHYIWSVTVRPAYRRLQYYFEICSGEETWLLLEDDFYTEESLQKSGRCKQYFKFAYINNVDVITPPAWVADTVWYQIMPDRFCRSGSAPKKLLLKRWDDRKHVTGLDFYGGDLRGITEKLPYLQQLGITGIYLLPIFLSNSNHKYNTFDYEQIDPDFGTEEDVKELVRTAHSLGIRVMLDAVFNHSGTKFFAWQDVWKHGEESRYYDWFCIHEKPFRRIRGSLRDGRFDGFAFLDGMPKLNTGNPEVMAYFAQRCRYWVENWDIDGIRFDVGNEISHAFLKNIRRAVKQVKPDVFLLGEIWMDSVTWLQGDEYDSVMNYPFFESVQNFYVEESASSKELMYALERCYSLYPEQVNRCIFNFLDTHDTMRARTRCGDEDAFYQQLALLMTLPGSACIYYGTEIAMPGGHDPDCRRTMPWKEMEEGLHDRAMEQMKQLIALRKENPQARGCHVQWHHDPENPRLVCYERPGREENLRVYLNSGAENVTLPAAQNILFERKLSGGILSPGGVRIDRYKA